MRVIIEQNYEAMSRWAANHIVERIKAFKPTAKKPFILGLPIGLTLSCLRTFLISPEA